MKRPFPRLTLAVCACACFALSSCGAPPDATGPAADETATAGPEKSQAEAVLRQMADYLGELPSFSCQVDSSMRVQARGMDNRMATKMAARLERPNRIAVIVEEGMMGATIVSDGKQLTQYLPMMNRYSVKEAPADLAGLSQADGTMATSMMGLPRVAFPASGEEFYKTLMEGVTKSEYMGEEKIGDVTCHHLRFYQKDFDWDIWIEKGDRPVLHKLVPDMAKRLAEAGEMLKDAKLEYSIEFSDWNVAPKFTEADFAFTPPEGAAKVDSLFAGLGGMGNEEPELHGLLGQPAPAFQTVDHEGHPIDLGAQVGKNVILLDFWATWCGPCVEAMPQVDEVAKKFADRGLVFYAVNSGEDAETVKEFLKTQELDLPVAMDMDGKVSELYLVTGIPQTVLIGKDGKVQVVHVGFGGNLGELLTKEVEDLLAGKDLASEALAKAAEAREKRGAQTSAKGLQAAGVTTVWSSPGKYSGVAVDAATNTVYATSPAGVTVIDAAGKVQREIAVKDGDILRLANLAGDGAPEMVVFTGWGPSVKAFNAAGESVWEYSPGDGVDDVWPADLDGDGMDEVVIGYNGGTGLHVLDQRGTPLWKFAEIGNVWHVTAGNFQDGDDIEVVTTSASGDLHVFDTGGKKLKDIDVSIYASIVRLAKLGDDPKLAYICGAGDAGEVMIAVNAEGDEKWALALPHLDVDHVDDLAISPTTPWAAVAMRGGLVHIVDLDSAQIVARATEQGPRPQVAWLARENQSPLLLVASGSELNAFEVSPGDLEAAVNGGVEQATESTNATAPAGNDEAPANEETAAPASPVE